MRSMKQFLADYRKKLELSKTKITIFFLTVSLNLTLYMFFITEETEANLSNIYSWFTSMMFAFGMYKVFIVNDNDYRPSKVCRDFGKFFVSMMVLGIIPIALFYALYSSGINQPLFGIDGFSTKIIVTIIEIILNRL